MSRHRRQGLPGRRARNRARAAIVKAANKARKMSWEELTMQHLQLAVFRCRQKNLVSSETLRAAGFNARRR